ncbi:hypothetical protein BDA99DRAFT_363380 [Phascolomyces articulosus]|uniref:Uncharacterized protein n=1 Tax=Phascolomyces articulosus TaxID=60185 RepID=A0AAD5KDK9_9FUNG|nr:hypothetical protein BDA99DRAFT_363380 [Phascolomyces articulosus]
MVTLRDIQRSINQTIRNATPDTDGQNTLDTIDTFLDEHGTTIDALSKNAIELTSTGTTPTTVTANATALTAATASTTTAAATAAAAAATVAVTTSIGSNSNTAINNEAIDRLSNELFQLYNDIVISPPSSRNVSNTVSCSNEALLIHNQHYLILLFVRKLAPLLGPDRIFFHDWWTVVLKPVLGTASYTENVRREARAIVSDCLVLEKFVRNNNENKYAKKVVDEYLGWSENYSPHEEDSLEALDKQKQVATSSSSSSLIYGEKQQQDETTRLRLQHQALLDLEQDEWSKSLVAILLSFGSVETKRFFMILNEYFLQTYSFARNP